MKVGQTGNSTLSFTPSPFFSLLYSERILLLQRLRLEDEERRKREAQEKLRREKLEEEMRKKREAGKWTPRTLVPSVFIFYYTRI